MGLIYQGRTDSWHEQPGRAYSSTEEGAIILEFTLGAAKTVTSDGPALGTTYDGYYLTSRTKSETAAWKFLSYRGMRINNRTEPRTVSRYTVKSYNISTDTPEVAHREIIYRSPEINYSYIQDSKESSGNYRPSASGFVEIIDSVITTEDGTRFPGTAPAGLVSALSVNPRWILADLQNEEIYYTPYHRVVESWTLEFPPLA